MANHLRRQIRERVATMLTGLSSTGSNVFQSHVYPLETDDFPALCVYTQEEEIEVGAMGDPRVCHSNLTLIVDGYAQATSGLDDVLDQIGKEVQVAMAGDVDIQNLVKDSYLSSVDISYSGEGTSPIGMIRHNYLVLYRYAENAPDSAL
nr:Phage minor tail protein U [uncultured Mediterranean phage uvMED]